MILHKYIIHTKGLRYHGSNKADKNGRTFGFEISAEDMAVINAMEYCGGSGLDPDEIDF